MRIDWQADGELLAVAYHDSCVHVWEVDSGRRKFVLKGHRAVVHNVALHPDQNILVSHSWDGTTRVWSLADGSQLATACGEEGIRVWDLRRIRARLATMQLDWNMPPYSLAAPLADRKPLQVKIELGALAGTSDANLAQRKTFGQSITDLFTAAFPYAKALKPDEDIEAVRRRAKSHFDSGQYKEAASNPSSCPAHVWFFLAMAEHQLDHSDQARQWYDKAAQWKTQYLEKDIQVDDATLLWTRQLTLELLSQEATALLEAPAAPSQTPMSSSHG